MRFAIERASNKYLWELDCLYDDYDFEDYLEKMLEKPIDVNDVYLYPLETEYGNVNIWCVDIFTIDDLISLCNLAKDEIVVQAVNQHSYHNERLNKAGIGVLTVYDSYLD